MPLEEHRNVGRGGHAVTDVLLGHYARSRLRTGLQNRVAALSLEMRAVSENDFPRRAVQARGRSLHFNSRHLHRSEIPPYSLCRKSARRSPAELFGHVVERTQQMRARIGSGGGLGSCGRVYPKPQA